MSILRWWQPHINPWCFRVLGIWYEPESRRTAATVGILLRCRSEELEHLKSSMCWRHRRCTSSHWPLFTGDVWWCPDQIWEVLAFRLMKKAKNMPEIWDHQWSPSWSPSFTVLTPHSSPEADQGFWEAGRGRHFQGRDSSYYRHHWHGWWHRMRRWILWPVWKFWRDKYEKWPKKTHTLNYT